MAFTKSSWTEFMNCPVHVRSRSFTKYFAMDHQFMNFSSSWTVHSSSFTRTETKSCPPDLRNWSYQLVNRVFERHFLWQTEGGASICSPRSSHPWAGSFSPFGPCWASGFSRYNRSWTVHEFMNVHSRMWALVGEEFMNSWVHEPFIHVHSQNSVRERRPLGVMAISGDDDTLD